MPNQMFAVQYHDMNTATHNVAIMNCKTDAEYIYDFALYRSELPEVPVNDVIEIDPFQPPAYFGDVKLIYVNQSDISIPDIY